MGPEILENLLFSAVDLLRGSLYIVPPLFVLVAAGRWLNSKIRASTKWSWVSTAFLSTFTVMLLAVLFAYFLPILDALQTQSIGEVPEPFAPSLGTMLASFAFGLVKAVAAALVISVLLMPLEFVGLSIFEAISRRLPKMHPLVSLALTCYIAAIVSAAVILFIVPEAITGMLYFIYFGFT